MKRIKNAVKKLVRKVGDFFRSIPKLQRIINRVQPIAAYGSFICFMLACFTAEASAIVGLILFAAAGILYVVYATIVPILNRINRIAVAREAKRQERIANAMKDPNVRKVVGLIRNAESNERLGNKEAAESFRAKAEQFIEKYKLDRSIIAAAA